MDVHGNDNTPEWGYCKTPGCNEPAEPLWFSGDFPDDPDLLLCYKHTGAYIAALEAENATLRAALNTAEGTVEGCRNMLVEYGVGRAYGVDFRQELTTLLAFIRAALASEGGA